MSRPGQTKSSPQPNQPKKNSNTVDLMNKNREIKLKEIEGGVCYGITHTFVRAFVTGKDEFNNWKDIFNYVTKNEIDTNVINQQIKLATGELKSPYDTFKGKKMNVVESIMSYAMLSMVLTLTAIIDQNYLSKSHIENNKKILIQLPALLETIYFYQRTINETVGIKEKINYPKQDFSLVDAYFGETKKHVGSVVCKSNSHDYYDLLKQVMEVTKEKRLRIAASITMKTAGGGHSTAVGFDHDEEKIHFINHDNLISIDMNTSKPVYESYYHNLIMPCTNDNIFISFFSNNHTDCVKLEKNLIDLQKPELTYNGDNRLIAIFQNEKFTNEEFIGKIIDDGDEELTFTNKRMTALSALTKCIEPKLKNYDNYNNLDKTLENTRKKQMNYVKRIINRLDHNNHMEMVKQFRAYIATDYKKFSEIIKKVVEEKLESEDLTTDDKDQGVLLETLLKNQKFFPVPGELKESFNDLIKTIVEKIGPEKLQEHPTTIEALKEYAETTKNPGKTNKMQIRSPKTGLFRSINIENSEKKAPSRRSNFINKP